MRQAKTQQLIDAAYAVLADYHPMTVRQTYYQLVSRHDVKVEDSKTPKGAYQRVMNALVAARREGIIPWEWIEDRLREPRNLGDGWDDPQRYWDDQVRYLAAGYSRAIWPSQPRYIEVWLEKDALSRIFEDAVSGYNVTLNVGRGYDSWTSVREAAQRFQRREAAGKLTTVLHFGDFDPSGVDMPRSLGERLAELASYPEIVTISLTYEETQNGSLPESIEGLDAKEDDSRVEAFRAKYGRDAKAYELDALPPDDLRTRCVEAIEQYLDMIALANVRKLEAMERAALAERVQGIS
jgi:hypothetical protein